MDLFAKVMNYFQIAKQTSQKKPAHQQAKEKTTI
jgi:hypothetical protein